MKSNGLAASQALDNVKTPQATRTLEVLRVLYAKSYGSLQSVGSGGLVHVTI